MFIPALAMLVILMWSRVILIFFFKQKTAYEMLRSLVGSEMCIRDRVRQICAERGWQYDEIPGDLRLLHQLLAGEWPESDFLIVSPGQTVIATNDERIIGVAPASSNGPTAA